MSSSPAPQALQQALEDIAHYIENGWTLSVTKLTSGTRLDMMLPEENLVFGVKVECRGLATLTLEPDTVRDP